MHASFILLKKPVTVKWSARHKGVAQRDAEKQIAIEASNCVIFIVHSWFHCSLAHLDCGETEPY